MYYEIWKDSDQKNHIISEMTTEYIQNCIKSIESQCWEKLLKDGTYDEHPNKEYQVLSPDWCEHCANGYLRMFRKELKKRENNS